MGLAFNFKKFEGFDWNEGNLLKNKLKHRVNIKECEEVFYNKPLLINEDNNHSNKEIRFQALGVTGNNRLLFIVFTKRNNKVRVISARDQSKKERLIFNNINNI